MFGLMGISGALQSKPCQMQAGDTQVGWEARPSYIRRKIFGQLT